MQRIPFSRHATEAEFAAVMQIASCFNDAQWRGYPGMRFSSILETGTPSLA
ncbi:hypothetical protein VT03_15250 [Planctomyces sp. SH-PL14]|nr:hypothetical protein VT03_15250 [Planctomyces sp. SH-PL14]